MTDTPTRVDFWFDPVCPWTWMTSRWLLEVADHRPLDIHWRVMSLSVLNEGRDVPEQYVTLLQRAWAPVRVLTAARSQRGDEVVLPLFNELGERYHRQSREDDDAIIAGVLGRDRPPGRSGQRRARHRVDLPPAREPHSRHGSGRRGCRVASHHAAGCPRSGRLLRTRDQPCPPRRRCREDLGTGLSRTGGHPRHFHELKRSRNGGPVID